MVRKTQVILLSNRLQRLGLIVNLFDVLNSITRLKVSKVNEMAANNKREALTLIGVVVTVFLAINFIPKALAEDTTQQIDSGFNTSSTYPASSQTQNS